MHGSASASSVEQERTGGKHRPVFEPPGGAGGSPGSSSEREPTEGTDGPRAIHADLVVLAFVLARCEEQLAEVIRSLEGQGIIQRDIVAEAAALASEAAGDPYASRMAASRAKVAMGIPAGHAARHDWCPQTRQAAAGAPSCAYSSRASCGWR